MIAETNHITASHYNMTGQLLFESPRFLNKKKSLSDCFYKCTVYSAIYFNAVFMCRKTLVTSCHALGCHLVQDPGILYVCALSTIKENLLQKVFRYELCIRNQWMKKHLLHLLLLHFKGHWNMDPLTLFKGVC
jgi:hypothetical protein